MRMLTHNMLMCNKKGVQNGYPLAIKARRVLYEETEYSAEFVVNMIAKLEYPALVKAVR
jgi:multifunctional methyltransferase subunit TRM112